MIIPIEKIQQTPFPLKYKSIEACIDIFENFSEDEISTMSASIKNAWNAGRLAVEYIKETDNKSDK